MTLDKEIRDRVMQEVRDLPQIMSGAIPEERVGTWLNQVARIDAPRIAWHVRRLGGIGGSEIASVMGMKGAYSTPEIIAKHKLMIIPPFRPTAAMKRGATSEEFLRDLFEGAPQSGTDLEMTENLRANALTDVVQGLFTSEMDRRFGVGTWRPRPDLEAVVQRPRGNRGRLPAWAIGSPDRIYEINIDGQLCIVPVDFKAPSEETMKDIKRSSAKLLPWRAQVQHYGMILEDCDFRPAGLVLAVFDYANVGTSTFLIDETVSSPEFCDMMLRSGNKFWNEHILTGVVPQPELVMAATSAPDEIEVAAKRSIYFAAMRDAAKSQLDEAQAPIRDWIMKNPEANGRVALGALGSVQMWSPRLKREFNAETAILRLIETGRMTQEETLALRGPSEAIPPSDPRFAVAIGVAQEKLSQVLALVEGLEGGKPVPPETLAALKEAATRANYCANPKRLGPPKEDLVKTALLQAGEPLQPYITTSLTIARNGTKAGSSAFAKVTTDAIDLAAAYAERATGATLAPDSPTQVAQSENPPASETQTEPKLLLVRPAQMSLG